MRLLLVLGNQLFDPKLLAEHFPVDVKTVFMREDRELCTYFKFHQHKIVLFLSAMRTYEEELGSCDYQVHYEKLTQSKDSYEVALTNFIKKKKVKEVYSYEIEDRFFESRLSTLFESLGIKWITKPSPMFLSERAQFVSYLKAGKKPFMKTYYESERKRLGILVDKAGKPEGGRFSYDDENRVKLPKNVNPPELASVRPTEIVEAVIELCKKEFPDHPGRAENFWLPVSRSGARLWLQKFLKERLEDFGTYEDALTDRSAFVFHSVLTPFLNTGLLTPKEVISETLKFAKKTPVRLASLEGFIRQVIGWREFIHGIDQNFGEKQEKTNFWGHHKKLKSCWYDGTTGIPPLDDAILKAVKYGYNHHIERLMVVGSLMLLLEVEPKAGLAWFMEMYVDSSDWVMGPNVYGMALFSDGGILATKPYICGSNYYRKMGGYREGPWCEGVDGLYWGFVDKHREFFLKNPRLSMTVRTYDKMAAERKKSITAAAQVLRKALVE